MQKVYVCEHSAARKNLCTFLLYGLIQRNKMEHVLLRSCVLTICNQVESGGRVAARFGKAGGYRKPRSELERGFRRAWIPLRAAP